MAPRSPVSLLLGISLLLSGCASLPEPENLDGIALLRATERGLFDFRTTDLFAVDGRRILKRDWVALDPGPHDIEIALNGFEVRRLRFEARAGVEYEVDHSGQWFDEDLVYWIAERESGTRVAAGDDSMGEGVRRQWYIDDFRDALGGESIGKGHAEFLDYNEDRITVSGAHDEPEFPSLRPGHLGTYEDHTRLVPAGTWVVEIHKYCLRKGCNYYGRLVATFEAGKTYALEHVYSDWTGIQESWLVDAGSGMRLHRFHTCKISGASRNFSMCEGQRNTEIHYAGVETGDPRFWSD